ncbi:hypothetical protein ACWDBW_18570 [Streptomyces sp. NPDC001107]
MTDDSAYGPTDARPGRPRPNLFEGPDYQGRTAPVPPMPAGAPPMPVVPPRPSAGPVLPAPPTWGPPMPVPARPPAPRLGARETLSRAVFGGFWCVIGVLGVVAAVSGLAKGDVGGFLLSALVATGSGFYARYIFRGGRFRILFW